MSGAIGAIGRLVIVACLIGVTGAALFTVQGTRWDGLSLVLGGALVLLIGASVWLALRATDSRKGQAGHRDRSR